MKKNIYLIILLFTFYVNKSHAQKPVKEVITISYTKLPLVALPQGIKTYTYETTYARKRGVGGSYLAPRVGKLVATGKKNVRGANVYKFVRSEEDFEKRYLTINSLKKVNTNADMKIVLHFGLIRIGRVDNVEATMYDGKKQFGSKYLFSQPAALTIFNKSGKKIAEHKIRGNELYDRSVWEKVQGLDVGSPSAALCYTSDYFSEKTYQKVNSFLRDIAPRKVSEYHMIYSAKSKKLNYEDLDNAKKTFKEAVKSYSNNKNGAKKLIQKSVDIWEKALTESDTQNKKARINKRVTYYLQLNLATAYWLLENFPKSKTFLKQAKASVFARPKEVYELTSSITDNEKRFKANSK